MKGKLPVCIESRELPRDESERTMTYEKNSTGFVSVIFLSSIITLIGSIISIIVLGK